MAIQHLIHIGYPKAGSTFLQAWFEQHPELYYRPGGLGGFHDTYGICRYSAAENDKRRYYVTSDEGLSIPRRETGTIVHDYRLEGSSKPIKLAQAKVCEILTNLFPDSRILIVTRGFKGIIRSGYSQLVKTGGIHRPRAMCAMMDELQNSDNHQYYDFDYLIELYSQAFGASNVIVLPYELLRDDQNAFIAALEKKLGLAHVELKLGRLNESLSPTELYWYPVISRRAAAIANRLGTRGSRKFYAWYVHQVFTNRWQRVIWLLDRINPGKTITEADFSWEFLRRCEGKVESLRNHPLYAPYAADYLWE